MVKLLGIKVAENMIQNAQYSKIENMILDKRFDKDAMRFIIENAADKLDYQMLKDSYSFYDIYDNWEDYIGSAMASMLQTLSINSLGLLWIEDFPSTCEEVLAIYEKTANKNLVFKNLIYRQRSIVINKKLRDKYCGCYEAIISIIMKEKEMDREEAVAHFFEWGFYVNEEIIKSTLVELGQEKTEELLMRRLTFKEMYLTVGYLEDVIDTIEFFISIDKLDSIKNYIYAMVNCNNFDLYGGKKEDRDALIAAAKVLYFRYVREDMKKDMTKVCLSSTQGRGQNRNGYVSVYAFEKDEKMLDEAFGFACKRASVDSAAREVDYFITRGLDVKITDQMCTMSVLAGRNFADVLLNKDITTADELLNLSKRVNPFDTEIRPHFNTITRKHIKISEFSDEDINKMKDIFEWDFIPHLFEEAVPPYEFLVRVDSKIKKLRNVGTKIVDVYTTEQISDFINRFEYRMDQYTMREIKSSLIRRQDETIDAESMAKIISNMTKVPFCRGKQAKAIKLDLQSVLTYL